jgi:hypothetical protein
MEVGWSGEWWSGGVVKASVPEYRVLSTEY